MIRINENIEVTGFDPGSNEVLFVNKVNSPKEAIELWFKKGKQYPTCVSIDPQSDKEAREILQWAVDNESTIRSWCSQYNAPYGFDYMMNGIKKQLGKSKILGFSYDMLYPFDMG